MIDDHNYIFCICHIFRTNILLPNFVTAETHVLQTQINEISVFMHISLKMIFLTNTLE